MVTPWNSHLGSEEYPQDARKMEQGKDVAAFEKDEVLGMARWAGLDPAAADAEASPGPAAPYARW